MARNLLAVILLIATLLNPRSAPAIAQRAGDFELEIDAPWRMEPRNGVYSAIPIQVSIHDADQPSTSNENLHQQLIEVSQRGFSKLQAIFTFLLAPIIAMIKFANEVIEHTLGIEPIPFSVLPRVVTLNQFQSVDVYEADSTGFVLRRTFTLADIHEVERTIGLWRFDAEQTGPESTRTPPPRPSHALCRRWQGQNCETLFTPSFAALRPTSEWHLTAMYTPRIASPGRDVRLRVDLRVSAIKDGSSFTKVYQRFLTVHLGEEPLPKFVGDEKNWAYGDLHYHSQGTDNDGESAYSYRGTLQAMGAMGLDFAFATDHASNSAQIGAVGPKLGSFELVEPLARGLRDLSPDRFAFNLDLLNGTFGGNREVTSYARPVDGQLVAPQLFLGSEVDVTPESAEPQGSYACRDLPAMFKVLDQKDPFPNDDCSGRLMIDRLGDGRSLLFDVQGPANGSFLSKHLYGRQHLIHLPVDGQRRDAFIPSNTSLYGGATRRLGAILDEELAARQKGFIFLAHPFDRASATDESRIGPDLVPYSQAQLEDAFESEHVLGLQIWNENALFSADANDVAPFAGAPAWERQHQSFHDYAFQQWDTQNLYGLDEKRTENTWLDDPETPASRRQPRRVLAAAGSDAHGDFNYRREGYFFGTSSVEDTALGNPRNLVYVGEPQGATIASAAGSGRPLSQAQVVDGLRSGNFTLTDGPAVRVMIDVNGDGKIDPGDVPMGGQHEHGSSGPFNVIVEWKSSDEFGAVESVDLLVGVWAHGFTDGIVYTRAYAGPIANAENTWVEPVTGKKFVQSPNIPYWYDPNADPNSSSPVNPLAIEVSYFERFGGRRVVTIDPNRYPMGYGECVHSTVRMASSGPTSVSNSPSSTTLASTISDGTTGGGTTTNGDGEVVYLQRSLEDQLKDLENGIDIPPPGCIRRDFAKATRPDRMFIRAEVGNRTMPGSEFPCNSYPPDALTEEEVLAGKTQVPQCVYRRAYTNPVWVNLPHCGNTNASCLESIATDGLLELQSASGSGSLPTSTQSGVTPQGTLTTTTTTPTSGTLSAEQLAALLSQLGSTTTTGTTSLGTPLNRTGTTTTSTRSLTTSGTTLLTR